MTESEGEPNESAVRARLDEVVDPCSASRGTELSVVEMGLVESVDVRNGEVEVSMRLTGPGCMQVPYFVEQVEESVGRMEGVDEVALSTDAGLEWTPEMMTEEAQKQRRERRRELEERYAEFEKESGGADEARAEGRERRRDGPARSQ